MFTMTSFLCLLLSILHSAFGDPTATPPSNSDPPITSTHPNATSLSALNKSESACIRELQHMTDPITLNLTTNTHLPTPNYSVATSVAYHSQSSTILIAGDYFYIDPKKPSNRTYYRFHQAFSHHNKSFNLLYSTSTPYTNPSFGNKLIHHKSLRSWTRIIAHPVLPYFYVIGINNLSAYHVHNGSLQWTAPITPCSVHSNGATARPLIYNDITFWPSDSEVIYVGGTCIGPYNHTVVVFDEYSTSKGVYNATFRQLYNLTDLGFFKNINFLNGFDLIPPEVTLSAPPLLNSTKTTETVDRYVFIGFTHLMFNGIARIERQSFNHLWRVETWPEHWTLVNPSFVSHRNVVATPKGLVSLLDPSIKGLISLFVGKMKHFTRWETEIGSITKKLEEKEKYSAFTWYGGHPKYDLHLDWTLTIDPLSDFKHIYVTTAPLELPTVKKSTVAKHDVGTGKVIGGQLVPFYAVDSIVTNDNQIITVGFDWTLFGEEKFVNMTGGKTTGTPMTNDDDKDNDALNEQMESVQLLMNPFSNILTETAWYKKNDDGLSPSDIMPFLKRKAVFQVLDNEVAVNTSCIGCEADHFGSKCQTRCFCENGYCDDDLTGSGDCYCTLTSYGQYCRLCDGLSGSCPPDKGICNSGPHGDGRCKLCFDAKLNISDSVHFAFKLGDKYGPHCNKTCSCNTENGICWTTGNVKHQKAGQCLLCTADNVFGEDCDAECDCDEHTEYCSKGTGGKGCVHYDYGGLLPGKGWQFYAVIASSLFVVMFTVTFLQSNRRYKERHRGQSMPWCPHREREEREDAEERLVEDKREKADLKEDMIRYHEQQQQSPPRNGHHHRHPRRGRQQNGNYHGVLQNGGGGGYAVLPPGPGGRKHINLQHDDENEPPITSHLASHQKDIPADGVVIVDGNRSGDELVSPEYPKRYNV